VPKGGDERDCLPRAKRNCADHPDAAGLIEAGYIEEKNGCNRIPRGPAAVRAAAEKIPIVFLIGGEGVAE
jgi:hypothetical protein